MMEQIDIRKSRNQPETASFENRGSQQQSRAGEAKKVSGNYHTLIQDMNAECQRLDDEVHKSQKN